MRKKMLKQTKILPLTISSYKFFIAQDDKESKNAKIHSIKKNGIFYISEELKNLIESKEEKKCYQISLCRCMK